jgi:hypothetical protein
MRLRLQHWQRAKAGTCRLTVTGALPQSLQRQARASGAPTQRLRRGHCPPSRRPQGGGRGTASPARPGVTGQTGCDRRASVRQAIGQFHLHCGTDSDKTQAQRALPHSTATSPRHRGADAANSARALPPLSLAAGGGRRTASPARPGTTGRTGCDR